MAARRETDGLLLLAAISSSSLAASAAANAMTQLSPAQQSAFNGLQRALSINPIALLWGDLLLSLLMRVRKAPTEREIQTRARAATETLFCRFPSSEL